MNLRIITFWLIIVITAGLAFLAWWPDVWAYPMIENAPGSEIFGWYQSQFLLSAAIGTGFGFLWGASFTHNRVLHKPKETAGDFRQRVLRHGLKGMALSGLVVFVIACGTAAALNEIPGDPSYRIFRLVFHRKGIGVLCAVAPTMGLAWGVTIKLMHGDWGGARALLP